MGTEALMGVAKIRFFSDLVPALPPTFLPMNRLPRQERAWNVGMTVGERAGKIEAPRASLNPPSPGAAPKKKAQGGGVITVPPSESRNGRRRSNLPPPPTRPHPWH